MPINDEPCEIFGIKANLKVKTCLVYSSSIIRTGPILSTRVGHITILWCKSVAMVDVE